MATLPAAKFGPLTGRAPRSASRPTTPDSASGVVVSPESAAELPLVELPAAAELMRTSCTFRIWVVAGTAHTSRNCARPLLV